MSISNLSIEEKVENQGATDAGKLKASEFNSLVSKANELIDNANSAFMTIANMESATEAAKEATDSAYDTANHPTKIGDDHYVYIWNKTTQAYDKTTVYTKGDAFSVSRVFKSIAEMEAYTGTDIQIGDFVIINSGDVEDADNAKLYVKDRDNAWQFLVDMSGFRGFTGFTPQITIGTVGTIGPSESASVSLSENGTDAAGNPCYLLNFAIPKGDKLLFSDLTEDDIKVLQQPLQEVIEASDKAESSRVDAETERADAEAKRKEAEASRVEVEASRVEAESSRVEVEASRVAAETAREEASATAVKNAEDATATCVDYNNHPTKIGDNGNWWKWNIEEQAYEDTGVIAKGGALYPTFTHEGNKLYLVDCPSELDGKFAKSGNKLTFDIAAVS